MLEDLIGKAVVIDLSNTFVCFGTLGGIDDRFLELTNADVHDLRDADTSRENYAAETKATGIKRNRRRALVARHEIVAVAAIDDVVDE